jgi:phosphate uptake regulator
MSEIRKVQLTQSGTYFICIPKSWAKQQGLKKGKIVSLSETVDGKLLIDPKYDLEPSPRTITLKPTSYLNREIVGKYLLGFDIIRIETKEQINFDLRESIKKTVSKLIGLEIVEEDYSSVVLQCLLKPSGFPPEKILRRSYALTAGMHRDVVNALLNLDINLAKNVIARDEEVNRLYFLLVRILRTVIQNPSLSEKLVIYPIECLDYRLTASLVEAIGDECVNVAQKILELKSKQLTKELKKAIIELNTLCSDSYKNALTSFLSGDISLAEEVRNIRDKIELAFIDIEEHARAHTLDIVPHIVAIAANLKQIYENSVDIADLRA